MQIKEMLINAGKNGAAAGAFNILNYTTARAVIVRVPCDFADFCIYGKKPWIRSAGWYA